MSTATSARHAIIIFGSKVLEGGRPSGSLYRRTLGALRWARARRLDPVFVVSGGLGEHGPAEAVVMRDLLVRYGARTNDIVMDTQSARTLDNARNTSRIIRRIGVASVWVCSDDYHVPRCWMLTRLFGLPSRPIFLTGSRIAVGNRQWAKYCAHEAAAGMRDLCIALVKRVRG